jgi:glycosyltransferase involved in cell wall biosynthesis
MVHDYPPLSGGGLALSVLTLAEMASKSSRVDVLSSRRSDHFADDSDSDLSEGVEYAPYVHVHLATPRGLLRWCREADQVLVHWTFSFRPLSTLALLLAPLLGKATVCVIHTAPRHCEYNRLRHLPLWARHALFQVLQHGLLAKCSAVVALSASHAISLADNGISVTHVLPVPLVDLCGHVRRSSRGDDPVQRIGVAGELSHLKGAEWLPGIIRSLTDNYRLHIAGAGPLARDIAKAVKETAGARARITLLGRLRPSEMPNFYDSIDCLLVTSATESQCRVAIEAMLRGVIVLARRSDGLVDLIVDGATGFFIDPADIVSVRRCMDYIRNNPVVADGVREQAYREASALVRTAHRDWHNFLATLGMSEHARGAGKEQSLRYQLSTLASYRLHSAKYRHDVRDIRA